MTNKSSRGYFRMCCRPESRMLNRDSLSGIVVADCVWLFNRCSLVIFSTGRHLSRPSMPASGARLPSSRVNKPMPPLSSTTVPLPMQARTEKLGAHDGKQNASRMSEERSVSGVGTYNKVQDLRGCCAAQNFLLFKACQKDDWPCHKMVYGQSMRFEIARSMAIAPTTSASVNAHGARPKYSARPQSHNANSSANGKPRLGRINGASVGKAIS
ncbi:hypothetical protein Hypma_003619 [Hypsizygus marmoreus]|uniref:Uncharacterized protein n=1 Tax=Hypsizygus marmoreus TaxID=39966 RepID=A0A369J1L7_HYPMA|nr:hypothetical protein Hypma_003619 [Hypsizygus marmoreus]